MTEQDWFELGRRAVACRGWRWMPGMKINLEGIEAIGALRVASVSRCGAPITRDEYGRLTTWSNATLPDLRDPATLGCLLALVREVHGDASGGPVPVTAADRGSTSGGPPVWFVVWSHGPCGDPFNRAEPTEAAALVAALEFER